MVQTTYSAEVPKELDQPAYDARRADGVTLRMQPDLLQESGKYHGWRGVAWRAHCETPEEAIAVREALRVVFLAITEKGPKAVMRAVQELRRS
jgi:hypothetical protein